MDEQFYDSNNSYENPSQEIPVCTQYEVNGEKTDDFPFTAVTAVTQRAVYPPKKGR